MFSISNSPSNSALSVAFQGLVQKGDEIGIQFTAVKTSSARDESVENGKYVSFMKLVKMGWSYIKLRNNSLKSRSS